MSRVTSRGLGNSLRVLRLSAGMSMEQVSDAAGVSAGYLAQVEDGLVTPRTQWVGLVAATIGDRLVQAGVRQ